MIAGAGKPLRVTVVEQLHQILLGAAQALEPSPERGDLEQTYESWLYGLFPSAFTNARGERVPFAHAHRLLWSEVWSWQRGVQPTPVVLILGRGGGKSTNAELVPVNVGARDLRKYCLYVSASQDLADKHVESIASRLESNRIAEVYPLMAERRVGKYGNSRGWRRNRLSCANGFTVEAIGLDVASRGIKVDDYRPDVIIFDDVDSRYDDREAAEKKAETISRDILPTMSEDCGILFIQNIIHHDSVCAALANMASWRAEFLFDRRVIGPTPALLNFSYEMDPETGRARILTGTPTWAGQDLARCQAQVSLWGIRSFRAEAQHEDVEIGGGLYEDVVFTHCAPQEVPDLERVEVWADPAVSDTDQSDSNGLQCDGLGADGKLYRLFSWERRASPRETVQRAIEAAVQFGATKVGIETDQGGDLWEDEYHNVWREMVEDGTIEALRMRFGQERVFQPAFASAKAGSVGSKAHRGNLMRAAGYEAGKIVHVYQEDGSHVLLENGLRRFLAKKPYDLADCAFWSWFSITGKKAEWDSRNEVKHAPGSVASAVAKGGWAVPRSHKRQPALPRGKNRPWV